MKKYLLLILILFFSYNAFSQNASKELPFQENNIHDGIPYINGQAQPYYYDPVTGLNNPTFKEGFVYINPSDNSVEAKSINSSSYFFSSADGKLLLGPTDNSFQVLKKPFKGIGIRKIEEVNEKGDIIKASSFTYSPFPTAPIEGNHR